MRDRLGVRWSHVATVVRGERLIAASARLAIGGLLDYAGTALMHSGYRGDVLSATASGWRESSSLAEMLGHVEAVFISSWGRTARGELDPSPYAVRHLEAVHNRLAGVPDTVFDEVRTELAAGYVAQEGIPQLAARVNALLADDQRWASRATTIARTETVAAANGGAYGSAQATADVLGVDHGDVEKEWLATSDDRTRDSHAEADGQTVTGMGTPFIVGGSELDVPGDPDGDPGEVINCRCTVLFNYPDDAGYGGGGDGGGAGAPASVTVARTPAAHDPGPQSGDEHSARSMTPEELVGETQTSGGLPKRTARAELRRRNLSAAATTQEDGMADTDPEDHSEDTTVWVALLPTATDPVQSIGDEDPKHCTLLFLGESAELTSDDQASLTAAVTAWSAGAATLTSDVTGVDSLGEEGARVWTLAADPVTGAFDALRNDPAVAPLWERPSVEQFPSYTPHVTIGYAEESMDGDGVNPELTLDEATETAAAAIASVSFDRVAIWWAGAETTYTLGQEAPVDDTAPPADAVTAAAGDPAPVPTEALSEGDPAPPVLPDPFDSDQFYGVAVVEDSQTGDGRVFGPNSLRLDAPLPMPLGWQVADAMGHDGSVVCGRFDSFLRFGNLIAYTGTWDLGGAGWETRRLVEGQFLTGLSVDTDDFDAQVVGPDGSPVDPMEQMFGDAEAVLLITGARIRSAAMCRVPAFTEAFIANGVPPDGWMGERPAAPADATPDPAADDATAIPALVAAAGRAGNPASPLPPAAWFANPQLDAPTPVTVTDEGRVYGHIAAWGTCHIGVEGQCVTPPLSYASYAYFMTGEAPTAEGTHVPVGQITMGTGHAAPNLAHRPAVAHYDDTGAAYADVSTGEDEHGIWIAGAERPEATAAQRANLRAAGALSGDWRRIGGHLELVAALAVNVPGFPLPRLSVAASAGTQLSLVAAGVVPADLPAVQAGQGQLLNYGAIAAEVVARLDRRARAQLASRRLRANRAGDARARLAARAQVERTARAHAAAATIQKGA